MTSQARAIADGFGVRLALFYAGLFVVAGVQLPFFPLWLKAKGLDAQAIGLVLATPMVVRVVAVPVAARIADRLGALRRLLIAGSCGAAIGYALVGGAQSFVAILAAVALAAALAAPTIPLADAYALKGLGLRGRAYGPVRLWGSVAFIAANLGAGFASGYIAPTGYIWLMVAASAATAAASLGLRPLWPAGAPEPPTPRRRRRLLPAPGFLPIAVAASLVQASHAVYYGFSTLDWTAKGLSGTAIGSLWALGVAAEIVLFALSARLPAALGPRALLVIGAAGAAIRWTAMALDPPTGLLPLLQCLHALSFGASFLGAVQFLARAASEGEAATVQADFSTLQGIVMAAATGLSGLLYGRFGGLAYAAMAVCAVLGGIVALAGVRRQ
ncbi:MAG TPA: MFS transporter [Xanthobacteraceae bacterium]|jgi:PPP family 3-phenylpropionic acid transporter|nr:MFS transporter [Xanthobacteraceae bacterium]